MFIEIFLTFSSIGRFILVKALFGVVLIIIIIIKIMVGMKLLMIAVYKYVL